MRRIVLLIAAMSLSMGVFAQQAGRITIDGKLNEPFWQRVKAEPLRPAEPGVPAKLGGEVRAAIAGGYLYIGATLPEPTGHFTARSIGRNPLWEGGVRDRSATGARSYTYGSPDGEDFVRFILHIYNENDWLVQVGPLGGNSIKWHWSGEHAWYPSMPYKCNGFMIATSEGNNVWTAEIAIPLEQIGTPEPGYVQLKVERNRAWRPRSPEEWWVWPLHNVTSIVPTIQNAKLGAPVYQPRLLGTDEHLPPIQAGHVSSVPPLQSKWTGPGWADVPAWNLWRNEAAKRLPEFPTEVKLVQDGSTLAVLARMYEPDHVIPQEKNVHGDSFSVYLATTGSSYVEYTINSEGTIDQAAGHQGGPRLGRPHSWKSPATGAAWQENGEWFARLNVPLARISEALGEVNIPGTWRILLERTRPERGGEPSETSVLPDTESTTSDCPARYRRMELSSVSPSQLPKPSAPERPGNIGVLPGRVFSAAQRKQMNLSNMLPDYERTVGKEMIAKANQAWASVGTVAEWDEYRDQRIDAMKKSLGQMPAKAPLDVHISSDYHGNGYHRQNLVFQSQPGIWVTADLYLPDPSRNQMPGMIIFPSHHGPKTQFEVQDMGIMWAREGCAVLAIDQIGYGGRIQTYPWDRANYDSLYTIGEQLYLTNSSLITWMIQDVEASINLLWQRPDVNKKEIILLGSVAGGAEPMAYTAALDSRVAAVVPFNFGRVTPLNDPMGGEFGDWESDRSPRWSISGQFLPWLICASVAPRYLILSKEVNWDKGELKPVWTRDEKVWGFYDATDHLAEAHGFGTFPGPGEAWSIGPGQRRALEPILERWFGIPIPWEDQQRTKYVNLQKRPVENRRPPSDLMALTPALADQIQIKTVAEIAMPEGKEQVEAARQKLATMSPSERQDWLRKEWKAHLGGNIEPNQHPRSTVEWTKNLRWGHAEAISLTTDPGVVVPMLLLLPRSSSQKPAPVVVAVSEGGKDLFLDKRNSQIGALLESGYAVCLPDVRGTGETTADGRRDPDGAEITLGAADYMMDDSLLGQRLKDLRTVLVYLRGQREIDARRIGLWGVSFEPANPAHMLMDELPQWRIGPQIEQHAEPLGGILAMLGALFEPGVKAVAVHSNLSSFLSMLQDGFPYVPQDVVVPGVLNVGDIGAVAAALAPRPLEIQDAVNGKDQLVSEDIVRRDLGLTGQTPSSVTICTGDCRSATVGWFRAHL